MVHRRTASGTYVKPYRGVDFAIASPAVKIAVESLNRELSAAPIRGVLRNGLCNVAVHGTSQGSKPVVSLFYKTPLPGEWLEAAEALRERIELRGIVGRAKGERQVCGEDTVIERIEVRGRILEYEQIEGHFSNPNSHISAATLEWLCESVSQLHARAKVHEGGGLGDLLEMFCGNGNHTIALAHCGVFSRIVGVEIK